MTTSSQRSLAWLFTVVLVYGTIGCSSDNHHNRSSSPDPQAKTHFVQPIDASPSRALSKQAQLHQNNSPTSMLPAAERMDLRLPRDPVRGIYVSGWVAGSQKPMDRLLHLIDTTDLNAMVIDIKNDYGEMTYISNIPEVRKLGANARPAIRDVQGLIGRLKSRNIYCIGRIVVFKDPLYVRKKPGMAFQKKNGGIWRDHQGKAWVDPYQEAPRSYNIAIAEEAARLGFDEIQFDYVRFPDNGAKVDKEVRYAGRGGKSKSEAIQLFLQQASDRIHGAGANLSADVFGLVTSSEDDMGIGQTWPAIASVVDVISPMTYPSHYSQGMYGVSKPDLQPYRIIHKAMKDAQHRNGSLSAASNKTAARIRPWLQGFTATWLHPHLHYGADQIHMQINAAKEQGVKEFLLWSPNCKYDYRSSN